MYITHINHKKKKKKYTHKGVKIIPPKKLNK